MFRAIAAGAALALLMAGSANAELKTITDDQGRQVTLDLPIRKAAVFNAWNAELFRAIGGAGSIAGLDAGTAGNPGYWPASLTTPETIIGQGQTAPNYERIVALKPDVVVIPANGVWQEAEAKLKPFGIPVIVMTGFDPVKHIRNAQQVGELLGKPKEAQAVADFFDVNMRLLAERLKDVTPRRIYLENWAGIVSPLATSGWDNMMKLAGGANIFGDIEFAKQPSGRGSVNDFQIDQEQVILRNPELIFKMGCCNVNYPAPPAGSLKATADELMARPGWNSIQAVKSKEVHVIGFFAANVVSKMIAAMYLAKAIYPDRFSDVDPEGLMKTWLEKYQGVPYTAPYSYSPLNRYGQS
jgi:iron complex transport system substrate-binding protein